MSQLETQLVFHHTAVIVRSMKDARQEYALLFGTAAISDVVFIASQGVNVCFAKVGHDAFLELVESTSEESKIGKMARKMAGYYHVAYKVKDIERAVAELEALGFKLCGDYFFSEAFQNKRCIFLYSGEAHLMELIEA
jgi:catechol 2,3-dioxygenase-like lactoylglutathione lyase family enzyme